MRLRALTSAVSALAALGSTPAAFAQRLPGDAVPTHYAIALSPDLASGSLDGRERIELRLARPAKAIVLNSVGFQFANVSIRAAGASIPATVAIDEAAETATLRAGSELPAGDATIELDFKGRLRSDLRGLYVSTTERRKYAVTQFEGTYARMAFPCFDEPAYKATFDLSVVVDDGDTAISNGRIDAVTPGPRPGKSTIRFARSPRMSTYLVALAIGDFACEEGSADGVPIRVCAVPERKALGRFALRAAERFLHWYNGWFAMPYPFGKLDMLAIPDYEWGGMENTAAVFYKERALLLDEAHASVGRKRGVAGVVAHEMAHQWFGDLVTMAWWDDVWLNEGFATWMERKPLADWDPSWDQQLEAARTAAGVLGFDSLASTRAIHATAETPAEIKEMFDGISYEKGASVLEMLEGYLGPDALRAGVNAYLRRYQNGNATAGDLGRELASASGKQADRIMASFVGQPGAPLVRAQLRCDAGAGTLTLTQQRFFENPKTFAAAAPQRWIVPVCAREPGSAAPSCVVLSEEKQSFPRERCGPLILNAGGKAYYRSAYEPEQLRELSKRIETDLSAAERVALVGDQWALVRAGEQTLAGFLDLVAALRGERERAVVEEVLERLGTVRRSLVDDAQRPGFDAWVRGLLGPAAAEIGWSGEASDTDDRRSLRARLLGALAAAGDAEALARAKAVVAAYAAQPASVDSTLAEAAFGAVARTADAALYDDWLRRVDRAATPEEHDRYLFALALVRDPALVARSIALWSSPTMREQDLAPFVSAMIFNPASRDAAWAALQASWSGMRQKVISFGGSGAVEALGSYCDALARDRIASFFAGHPTPEAERTVKRSLESIDDCAALKAAQAASLASWLAAR